MLVLGAVLIAVAFAALSNGLSLVTRTRETLIAAATALVLPLSFLSFAFMQANLVPGWIAGGRPLQPGELGGRNRAEFAACQRSI